MGTCLILGRYGGRLCVELVVSLNQLEFLLIETRRCLLEDMLKKVNFRHIWEGVPDGIYLDKHLNIITKC